MITIKHRFISYPIDPDTEYLIIGTFNPETEKNKAEFFYGRSQNYLWTLLPAAFGEANLKKLPKSEKEAFIDKYKIRLVDLIEEVTVDEGEEANYNDAYIDKRVTKWRNIIRLIDGLPHLKKVCFTRKTFSGVPNIRKHIEEIQQHCESKGIKFKALPTPARFYNSDKQQVWSDFFRNDAI